MLHFVIKKVPFINPTEFIFCLMWITQPRILFMKHSNMNYPNCSCPLIKLVPKQLDVSSKAQSNIATKLCISEEDQLTERQNKCLLYTQEVRGPNPLLPTNQIDNLASKSSQKYYQINSQLPDLMVLVRELQNSTDIPSQTLLAIR